MNSEQAWQSALGQLQMEMPKASFDTWVRDTKVFGYDEEKGVFTVAVRNAYARDWLESRLTSTVVRLLMGIMNRSIEVVFVVKNEVPAYEDEFCGKDLTSDDQVDPALQSHSNTMLNTGMTFEKLVVCPRFNGLAVAAAQAIVDSPGDLYNPLYLCGKIGLGKSHLLHAIGNASFKARPVAKIMYVTAEELTNELVSHIRGNTTMALREKYRGLDLLLVDDFQFMQKKTSTQDEFLHTIQTLINRNAQVVITADRPLKSLNDFDPAILSRIWGGLQTAIGAPTKSEFAQIIREMLKSTGTEMDDDTIQLIAGAVSDVRGVMGAIHQVTAMTRLMSSCPDRQYILTMLEDIGALRGKEPKADCIITTVAESFDIPTDEILGKKRDRKLVVPRQIVMLLMEELSHMSLSCIADTIGRDHSTVRYGIESARANLAQKQDLARQFDQIREKLLKGTGC
jgi:chromosomal replication initiator protein